ncbi:hypothetical protein GP486_003802 [Trichoglossum hirsutum]|uniref:Uncharacterized protein n=1 Tax=Trichoglossum hirsutum TaxID=265104 RepID=A0A9P8LCK6_9PEZI|nr:hypothetical protein GP486_003802 [Trichoglossum hirsutum]
MAATTADFLPTRTFYILPHCSLTKSIQILNLTPHLTAPYTDPGFAAHAKQVAKQGGVAPCITVQKANLLGTRYMVLDPTDNNRELATWKAPLTSFGSSHISFPPGSRHSSHAITLSSFLKTFTHNSTPYAWQHGHLLHRNRFSLWMELPTGERRLVARYWQGCDWRTGGTVVLDGEQVDELVALITCVAILKRKRQRQSESAGGR